MERTFRLSILLLLALLPCAAYADVTFSEIMYDPLGADTGHEWVEVHNTGFEVVDLSGWKFFEANTNHGLSLVQGAGIIPDGYAVIVDDPAKFEADWPSYSGVLFDSSFSLSNSGEALSLKDDSGDVTDSVTYDPSLGAGGDGNSLQWDGSEWVAAGATPGAAYAGGGSADSASSSASSGSDTSSDSGDSGQSGAPSAEKRIFVDAGPDMTLFTGADSPFTGNAVGLSGEPLENARYIWTFGDGGRLEGQSVKYHYSYPGTYSVFLDVSAGAYSASDRLTATVLPAQVSLPAVTSAMTEIKNASTAELDLGGWILAADGKTFVFPPHTVIEAGETVVISNERTGLKPSSPGALSLEYPNGSFAASYQTPLISARIPAAPAAPAQKVTLTASAPLPASEEDESNSKTQAAAAAFAEPGQGNDNFFPWLTALFVVLAAGVGALWYFYDSGPSLSLGAAEYEIEEEKP